MPAIEAISRTIMVLRCLGPMKAPRAGVRGRVVWTSRFKGPDMAAEECCGAPLHQLVHTPETGERPVHVPWPEEVFFFFFWPARQGNRQPRGVLTFASAIERMHCWLIRANLHPSLDSKVAATIAVPSIDPPAAFGSRHQSHQSSGEYVGRSQWR